MSSSRFVLSTLLMSAAPAFGGIGDGLLVNVGFDGSTGNQASGSVVTSTVIGTPGVAQYTAGRFGSAATFNNTNGGATTPNDWALSLGDMNAYYASDFSFSLWVNTTSTADQAFFGNSDWSSGGYTGWLVSTLSGKEGKFKTDTGGRQDQGLAIHTGTWVNVIAVVDFTANPSVPLAYWYVGGTLLNVGGASIGTGTLSAGYATLIGSSGNGPYGSAGVSIDDVGIWSRKLTASEITDLQTSSIATLTAVPEPSTYGIGAAGLAAVVAWKRRRSPRRA